MKKYKYRLLGCVVILVMTAILLNLEVTTLQGVNYKVHAVKLPLYLKLLDFFDRHYNYALVVRKITSGSVSDEDKVLEILEWMHKHIRENPKELPVIDDHVWHIIVRGYGVEGQFQDVFSTLCNYANMRSFSCEVYSEKDWSRKPFSFVRLGDRWSLFDAYNGVYFINKKGRIAAISELSEDGCRAVSIVKRDINVYYGDYFKNLGSINFNGWRLSRQAIQSPVRRLIKFLSGPTGKGSALYLSE